VWVDSLTKVETPALPIVPPAVPETVPEGDETLAPPAPVIEPEPVYETTTSSFLGGKQALDLLAKFTPLQAIRELPPEANLDMGLDEPFGVIEVTRKSGVLSLVVGKETFGGKQRFLATDERSFLINKTDVRPFERAEKLREGRIHPLSRLSATRVEVSAGEQTRVLERQNSADVRKSFWADPSTPETQAEAGETWVLKALDIKTKRYVQGEPPSDLALAFSVKLSDDKTSWTFEVRSHTEGDAITYYGKSDFTREWVILNAKAADAAADLDAFFRAATAP
jgi:hypothetical protein